MGNVLKKIRAHDEDIQVGFPFNGEPSPPGGVTGTGYWLDCFGILKKKFGSGKNDLAFHPGPLRPSRPDGSPLF